ncbi:hypothetical protein HMPREF0004_1878 [Achromobacter piechaudii ATCC 43553]|uniref:Uncharacterized protein n=1 Tax=Achromobacter piechaudii ATCC 43553 TaxID=742159 RepID=D4X8T1_9BURK|nr:hypothetical protein HMPREF0004_1878 [Achromobacter piechaudii ATCC 43553]
MARAYALYRLRVFAHVPGYAIKARGNVLNASHHFVFNRPLFGGSDMNTVIGNAN